MKMILEFLRRESPAAKPYLQRISFSSEDPGESVATALNKINAGGFEDEEGSPVAPIGFECSCLQKKCGACAMVIGGRPRLACDAKLAEFEKAGCVRIEPLRKFPPVRDLIVDRSAVFERLRRLELWLEGKGRADNAVNDTVFAASRCLQCGCCLEVCPNFSTELPFGGMSAGTEFSRLIPIVPEEQREKLYKAYRRAVYEGCGKSLACRNVCPAGIDIDSLLVSSNAAAVWKRRRRRKK